jgi:hypothetical protein
LDVTGVTGFGVDFAKLTGGEVAPPPAGARFDVWVKGTIEGKISGTLEGCDYLYVRADGRMELNVKGTITTDDGAAISLAATGVGWPEAGTPIVRLRENATLFTNHESYLWVNGLQIWAPGEVNLAEGKVDISGYGH